jgi:hypothetical protein
MSFDYFAENRMENRAATLGYLISKLKRDENNIELKYHYGRIVLRGSPEGITVRLTILPKGILKSTRESNHKTLKSFIESSGIN